MLMGVLASHVWTSSNQTLKVALSACNVQGLTWQYPCYGFLGDCYIVKHKSCQIIQVFIKYETFQLFFIFPTLLFESQKCSNNIWENNLTREDYCKHSWPSTDIVVINDIKALQSVLHTPCITLDSFSSQKHFQCF